MGMTIKANGFEELSMDEVFQTEGGTVLTWVLAGIAIGGAIYGVGYAIGQAHGYASR